MPNRLTPLPPHYVHKDGPFEVAQKDGGWEVTAPWGGRPARWSKDKDSAELLMGSWLYTRMHEEADGRRALGG